MNTDRIEKQILLRAPIQRVWRAISDSTEFGTWFGMKFDAPFAPGKTVRGEIVGTTVDPDVGRAQSRHKGMTFDITIEKMEPEREFSMRWHPFAIDPTIDYSAEPTTLVTFALQEVPEGVMLTVTESGFDKIPLERRAQAFSANEQGWNFMVTVLEKYVVNA